MRLLPILPLLAATALLGQEAPPAGPVLPVDTVITADGPGTAVGTDTETTVTVHHHVVVTGTNLRMTCDNLEVVADRKGDVAATVGDFKGIRYMLATGNVRIVQGDRIATAGRAEFFNSEGRFVLTESPTLQFSGEKVMTMADRMTFFKGKREAQYEGHLRFIGPEMNDLGYDKHKPAPSPAPPPGP